MRRLTLFSTGLVIGLSIAAGAFAQEMKPEEILKARQGLMEAVRMQLGPIVAVVKGNAPLSPATAESADTIVALAHALKSVYGQGTEGLTGSHAKAEAFSDPKFLGGYDKLAAAATKLAADARANNLDLVKADLGQVGGACKGCHDTYRVKF